MSTPLIPLAKKDVRYSGIVYGKEIEYYKDNATKSPVTLDGTECTLFRKDTNGIRFELICKNDPLTPYRLNVSSGNETLYQYIFDEYKRDLPLDMSLFEVPSGIDIMPVCAQNTSDEIFQKKREKDLLSLTIKKTTLTKEETWSLACSGMLWELMEGDFASLAGRNITETEIKQTQEYLREKWNIKDREEIFKAIYWFMTEGYQIKFGEFGQRLHKFSVKDFDDMEDGAAKRSILLVMKYYSQLPEGISGWDYGVAICLSRWGYCCGYLTEKESWYFIKLIGTAMKNEFNSWQDFGKSYYVGWNFMPEPQKKFSSNQFEETYKRFLNSTESPWKKIQWQSNK
jgi:hypothetical protein